MILPTPKVPSKPRACPCLTLTITLSQSRSHQAITLNHSRSLLAITLIHSQSHLAITLVHRHLAILIHNHSHLAITLIHSHRHSHSHSHSTSRCSTLLPNHTRGRWNRIVQHQAAIQPYKRKYVFNDDLILLVLTWSVSTSRFVEEHNKIRSTYGAPPLSWNPQLVPAAQQLADACAFRHTQNNPHGEVTHCSTWLFKLPRPCETVRLIYPFPRCFWIFGH
jgi:hypothetical protein